MLSDGYHAVLHARSTQRAAELGELREQVDGVVIGDLANARDVHGIADQVNAIGHMDAVIHNAGLYTVPERAATPDGHPTLVAVNTLAPYMLTALIERPARIIYVSSSCIAEARDRWRTSNGWHAHGTVLALMPRANCTWSRWLSLSLSAAQTY
ncbi:hypothetical protein [Sphingomonas sp. CFBP 13728]|uniref:hypothetical protein n=1 Tax=Sphingomonas sp. CFBP 13728 TaxID=2775294 RepID=UPI0018D63B35